MAHSRSISITSKAGALGAQVLLDGTNIANGVDAITVTMRAGQPTSVELNIPVIDITEIQHAGARVYISPASRAVLEALGWTPPAEPGEEAAGMPAADPLPDFIDIEEYRADRGSRAWVFRCWGHGTCEGALHLDLSDRAYAERKAREHLAAEHTTPKER